MVIYAGTNRYLDKVAVGDVKRWEKEFLQFMHDMHPQVPDAIRDSGKFESETEEGWKAAIEQFNSTFQA